MHSKRIQKKVKQDYNLIGCEFSASRRVSWADFTHFEAYYQPSFSVLDLGCGNGRLLHFLKDKGYRSYIGVDQSEVLLKEAQQAFPKENFVLADMSDPLPFPKASFDALFAIASFHHLPPQDQLRTLRHWKSLLKPGGFLFMINWNLLQKKYLPLYLRAFLFPLYGFRGVLVPWNKQAQRYYFGFTPLRLRRLLKKAGYSLLKNGYTLRGESASFWSAQNIVTIASNGSVGSSH